MYVCMYVVVQARGILFQVETNYCRRKCASSSLNLHQWTQVGEWVTTVRDSTRDKNQGCVLRVTHPIAFSFLTRRFQQLKDVFVCVLFENDPRRKTPPMVWKTFHNCFGCPDCCRATAVAAASAVSASQPQQRCVCGLITTTRNWCCWWFVLAMYYFFATNLFPRIYFAAALAIYLLI